jgi:hypothetical protein
MKDTMPGEALGADDLLAHAGRQVQPVPPDRDLQTQPRHRQPERHRQSRHR